MNRHLRDIQRCLDEIRETTPGAVHLEGGNGRRRQRQTVENVRMLCEWHHREAHRAARRPPEGKQDERAPQDKETRR